MVEVSDFDSLQLEFVTCSLLILKKCIFAINLNTYNEDDSLS